MSEHTLFKKTKYDKKKKPKASKYDTSTANGLTAYVVDTINAEDEGFAYRVNNGAVYDPKIKRFRSASTIPGIADISAFYKGTGLQIEIKIGKDRLSEGQKKFQKKIEEAGATYWVVKTAESFDFLWERFKGKVNK